MYGFIYPAAQLSEAKSPPDRPRLAWPTCGRARIIRIPRHLAVGTSNRHGGRAQGTENPIQMEKSALSKSFTLSGRSSCSLHPWATLWDFPSLTTMRRLQLPNRYSSLDIYRYSPRHSHCKNSSKRYKISCFFAIVEHSPLDDVTYPYLTFYGGATDASCRPRTWVMACM